MSPKYQVMPDLTDAEYEALKASIESGYDPAHPVVVDETGAVLDGHNRQRVCGELGITAPTVTLPGLTEDEKHDYALRANLACRHLTSAQKRELVRGELEHNPGRSDREIGRLCGVDHKTVGAVRRGEIPHPPTGDRVQRIIRLVAEADRAQAEAAALRDQLNADELFQLTVVKGREAAARLRKLGDLAAEVVTSYGEQSLGRYADEIGVECDTLRGLLNGGQI
jgi:hypothetical protein